MHFCHCNRVNNNGIYIVYQYLISGISVRLVNNLNNAQYSTHYFNIL